MGHLTFTQRRSRTPQSRTQTSRSEVVYSRFIIDNPRTNNETPTTCMIGVLIVKRHYVVSLSQEERGAKLQRLARPLHRR